MYSEIGILQYLYNTYEKAKIIDTKLTPLYSYVLLCDINRVKKSTGVTMVQ